MKTSCICHAATTWGLLVSLTSGVEAFSAQTRSQHLGHIRKSCTPSESLILRASSLEEEKKTDLPSAKKEVREESSTALLATTEDLFLSPTSGDTAVENKKGWIEPVLWRGVILVLCALWASNFAAAKLVMAEPGVDSGLYSIARFGVAFMALAPGAVGAAKRADMDAETVRGALTCGAWVAFGYLGQILGLLSTTASKSCVICSMHCVFVAVIAELWRVQNSKAETEYDVTRLIPAAIAVIGVAIIELKGAGGAPNIGDALSFAQPIGFGMGYLQLEELMKKNPEAGLPISALKLLVVALASFGLFELNPLLHGASEFALTLPDFSPIIASPLALGGILYTGLITTAAALWVESIAFKEVPATDASIILTTEPLLAAGVGAVTLGETFGMSDYLGASLIVGACALAVLAEEEEGEAASSPFQ